MKKHTAVYLEDLGIEITSLLDWLESKSHTGGIITHNILEYTSEETDESHWKERIDVRKLREMMDIHKFDILITP